MTARRDRFVGAGAPARQREPGVGGSARKRDPGDGASTRAPAGPLARAPVARGATLADWTRATLAELGIAPKRRRGQNFLVDRNLRDAILDDAAVGGDDVVLEVGGGLGVLSGELARRARFLHVVEIEPRLADYLAGVLPAGKARVWRRDALELDAALLEPRPTGIVANLPYAVAQTFLVASLTAFPEVRHWFVMVQLEVAERLAAPPGTRLRGTASALVQAACDVRIERKLPPDVFLPRPRVWSALLRLERVRTPLDERAVRLVRAGFAHRRKPLANALSRAGVVGVADRARVRDALAALGYPPDARAEALAADAWRRLADELAGAGPERQRGGPRAASSGAASATGEGAGWGGTRRGLDGRDHLGA